MATQLLHTFIDYTTGVAEKKKSQIQLTLSKRELIKKLHGLEINDQQAGNACCRTGMQWELTMLLANPVRQLQGVLSSVASCFHTKTA